MVRTDEFFYLHDYLLLQGDYIWIEPISGREFDVAIGARVVSAEGKRILIKDDDGQVNIKIYINQLLLYS